MVSMKPPKAEEVLTIPFEIDKSKKEPKRIPVKARKMTMT